MARPGRSATTCSTEAARHARRRCRSALSPTPPGSGPAAAPRTGPMRPGAAWTPPERTLAGPPGRRLLPARLAQPHGQVALEHHVERIFFGGLEGAAVGKTNVRLDRSSPETTTKPEPGGLVRPKRDDVKGVRWCRRCRSRPGRPREPASRPPPLRKRSQRARPAGAVRIPRLGGGAAPASASHAHKTRPPQSPARRCRTSACTAIHRSDFPPPLLYIFLWRSDQNYSCLRFFDLTGGVIRERARALRFSQMFHGDLANRCPGPGRISLRAACRPLRDHVQNGDFSGYTGFSQKPGARRRIVRAAAQYAAVLLLAHETVERRTQAIILGQSARGWSPCR